MTALYLHIPFCVHRCAYCDFNTYAGQDSRIPAYVGALIREIEMVAAPERRSSGCDGVVEGRITATSIFFGGGTPSLLTPIQLASIMEALHTNFTWADDLEASLEANPGTVSLDYLKKLRAAGFNRLSFGVQSSHPDDLHLLERIHDFWDVIQSVKWARQAGFDNLSLDLIFALPEQTLSRWQETLKYAVDLNPEHFSLYALTIEESTLFGRWTDRGLLPVPDPDLAAEMYEWASEYLEENGYEQYEISNWAKTGRECQHNLTYWRNQPYLGFGAGAHGYAARTRYSNVLRTQTYIDRLTKANKSPFPLSPAMVSKHNVSPKQAMQEHLMVGLRLTREGVSADDFLARFGVEMTYVFQTEIDELIKFGLLEWVDSPLPEGEGQGVRAGAQLRLTPRARLLGNQVFIRFVGE